MVERGPRRPRADLVYLQGVHVTGLESLAPDTTLEAYQDVVRSAGRPGHSEQVDRMDEVIHVNCGF